MTLLYALCDLHLDVGDRWAALAAQLSAIHSSSICIAPGDIATNLSLLERGLALLKERFDEVFFVPGNHELWCTTGSKDSLEKLGRVLDVCRKLEVRTSPRQCSGVWIFPLLTWYTNQWADSNALRDPLLEGWMDAFAVNWGGRDPVAMFNEINDNHCSYLPRKGEPIITTSHFVPRLDLLPPLEKLTFPGLQAVCGCQGIEDQLRSVGSCLHVFGHTHIPCDVEIQGVRYVNFPCDALFSETKSHLLIRPIVDLRGISLRSCANLFAKDGW